MKVEIKNLNVKTAEKEILHDFNLLINPGEIHAVMGPNGTGKSTLSKVIMGYPEYEVINGDILISNKSILSLEMNERAKLGIFLVYQNPMAIEGVTNSELIKASLDSVSKQKKGLYEFILELEKNTEKLSMDKDMLHRSFNLGFSGGERKKNEILQLLMLKPKFIILDELDSGLDVDSLKIVCDSILSYLKSNPDTSILMITHYTRILDYLKPDFVHMMINGKIQKSGTFELARLIEKYGYNQSYEMEGFDFGE